MWEAAAGGDVAECQMALKQGCDINMTGDEQSTPLFIACDQGHLDIVRLLLQNKCNIDQAMGNGRTPLFMACQEGHLDIARVLLENKCNIDKGMDDVRGQDSSGGPISENICSLSWRQNHYQGRLW